MSPTMVAVQTRHLRLGTWNVHEGVSPAGGDRDRVLDEIARHAHDARLDVLALQEVDFDRDGRSAVLDTLAGRTELTHVVRHANSRSFRADGCRSGLAIASRLPLSDRRTLDLTNPQLSIAVGADAIHSREYDKGMLLATVTTPFGPIDVASVHVYSFRRFDRAAEDFGWLWKELAAGIDEHTVHESFIGGDFNADDRTLLIERTTRRRLRSGVRGEPTHGGRSVDDVLYPDDGEWDGAARIVATFSDHHLCVLDLTAPQAR